MTRKYLLISFVGFVGMSACGDDAVPGVDTETDTEGDTTNTTTGMTMSATLPTTSVGTMETMTEPTTEPSTGEPSTGDPSSSSSGDPTTGPPPPPVDFMIRIENISDQSPLPTPFSAGVWVEHEVGSQPVFVFPNMAALGNGLVELAEDGDPAALDVAMEDDPMVVQHGIFDTPVTGTGPMIQPGEAYEFTIEQVTPFSRLSLITQMMASNDIFLGTGPNGVGLFAGNGEPQAEDDIAPDLAYWDVGSEANQPPAGGDYQGDAQAAANTGPDEDGVVSLRRESTHAVPFAGKLVSVNVEFDMMLTAFTVQITNIADDSGAFISPFSEVVWARHDDTVSIFTAGGDADDTSGLESLVEDGDPGALVTTLGGTTGVAEAEQTVVADPGDTVEFTVLPTADGRFVSFVAGLSWTNDAFISTGPGVAFLDDAGAARSTAAIERDFEEMLAVWDAGTEVNESVGISGPSNDANQAVPGVGTTENNPIEYYLDTTNDFATLTDFVTVELAQGTAGTIDLTITNVSESTPFEGTIPGVVWAMHDGYSGFTEGMAASPDLEDLAEDGTTTGLEGDIDDGGFTNHGVTAPLAPGESVVVNIDVLSAEPMLSIFAHVEPSNDTFIALGADGISCFNGATLLDDTALQNAVDGALDIYDAGTEANQAGGGGAAMSGVTGVPTVGPAEGNGFVRQVEDDEVWFYPEPERMIRVIVTPLR